VFQPSIFRCENVSFWEGNSLKILKVTRWKKKQIWLIEKECGIFFLQNPTLLFHRKRDVIYRTHLLMLEKSSKNHHGNGKEVLKTLMKLPEIHFNHSNWFPDFWTINSPYTNLQTHQAKPPKEPLVVDSDQKFPSYFPIWAQKGCLYICSCPMTHDPWQSFRRWREHLE